MDENRINTVLAVLGNRGTGKTDLLKSIIKSSSQQKRLIVDTFDSAVWHNLETWDDPLGANTPVHEITPDQLPFWNTGTYRIFSPDTDALMEEIERYVNNTLVVFEDATKYIGSTLSKEMKRFILDSKQKNLDLVFVFHSLKDLPRDLVRVIDYITLFKTGDRYNSNLRNKYPDPVETAHESVLKNPSKFYFETIQISG